MNYQGMVIRPPSEADSLLLQVTLGCSYGRCSFCDTYQRKTFRIRTMAEISRDIDESAKLFGHEVRRVFLCDGDALVMKMDQLREVLRRINDAFPHCERVGSYTTAADLLRKTPDELAELKELGLGIVYLGLESGSDEVLRRVDKGVDSRAMIEAVTRSKAAGITTSIMVISGLGGRELWEEHAKETARVLNIMRPDFLGLLSLQIIPGSKLWKQLNEGEFSPLLPSETVLEVRRMIEGLELDGCFYSSAHISNLIPQRGMLSKDKPRLLEEIDRVVQKMGLIMPE